MLVVTLDVKYMNVTEAIVSVRVEMQ